MTNSPAQLAAAAGYKRSRYSKPEVALLEELYRRCGGEFHKAALRTRHGSTDFQLGFLPKHQGFIVSVACQPAGRFRVTRKRALDRWMEGFVPALRLRSSEARFDREFNVHTRDLRITSDLLTQTAPRDAVRELFERGVLRVEFAGERVETVAPRKAAGKEPSADFILALVERLASIASAVTAIARRQGSRATPKTDPAVAGAWTLLGVVGVLGLVTTIGGAVEFTLVSPGPFFWPCALFGLPAAAIVALVLTFVVRGRSSPYGLVRGLTGVSLLVVPLFVSGALLLANGALDDSAAEEHVVTVVDKSVRENKNKLSYYAGLSSWWTEGEVRHLRVSEATYESIEPRVSRMQVRTRAGRFGYEWIETYDLLR